MPKDGNLPSYDELVRTQRTRLEEAVDTLVQQMGHSLIPPFPHQEVAVVVDGPKLQRQNLPQPILKLLENFYPERDVELSTLEVGKEYIVLRTKRPHEGDTLLEKSGAGYVVGDPLDEVVRGNELFLFPQETPMQIGVKEWSIREFRQKSYGADSRLVTADLNPDVVGAITDMISLPKQKGFLGGQKLTSIVPGEVIDGLSRFVTIRPNFETISSMWT